MDHNGINFPNDDHPRWSSGSMPLAARQRLPERGPFNGRHHDTSNFPSMSAGAAGRKPIPIGGGKLPPMDEDMEPDATTAMLDACIRDLSRRRIAMARKAARTASAAMAEAPDPSPDGSSSPHGGIRRGSAGSENGAGQVPRQLADYAGTAADSFAQAFVDRWASAHSNGRGGDPDKGEMPPSIAANAIMKAEPRHRGSSSSAYGQFSGKDRPAVMAEGPVVGAHTRGGHLDAGVSKSLGGLGSSADRRSSDASMSSSVSKSWWVCEFCKNKAFASRVELMEHENVCKQSRFAERHRMSHMNPSDSHIHGGEMGHFHLMGREGMMERAGPNREPDEPLMSSFDAYQAWQQRSFPPTIGMPPPYMPPRMGMMGEVPMGGIMPVGPYYYNNISEVQRRTPSRPEAADPALVEASKGPFNKLDEPIPLALDEDKDWLTPLHCFVRRHCVEVFTASDQDVQTPSKGKRKPIQVGQVGIRCPHCHVKGNEGTRERGSVYYPTSLSSIYNASMNLLQRHLHSCPFVPKQVMEKYSDLKKDDARSGTSKKYWIESAKSLGFVDTLSGIKLSSNKKPPPPAMSHFQEKEVKTTRMRKNSEDFYSSESNAIAPNNNIAPSSLARDNFSGEKKKPNDQTESFMPRSKVARKGRDESNEKKEDDFDENEVDTKPATEERENVREARIKPELEENKVSERDEAKENRPITVEGEAEDKKLSNSNHTRELDEPPGNSETLSSPNAPDKDLSEAPPLVIPADKGTATAFSFLLLSQMQPCVFTEADRLGKRKGLPTGFAGLACRHCFGGYGSGRFFPSSIKTLSDTSKTLNVLHNHMQRCRKCPKEIVDQLDEARKTHDTERANMKFGSQKAFFAKIWGRLHDNRPDATELKKRTAPPKPSRLAASNGHYMMYPPPGISGMMMSPHPHMMPNPMVMRGFHGYPMMMGGFAHPGHPVISSGDQIGMPDPSLIGGMHGKRDHQSAMFPYQQEEMKKRMRLSDTQES